MVPRTPPVFMCEVPVIMARTEEQARLVTIRVELDSFLYNLNDFKIPETEEETERLKKLALEANAINELQYCIWTRLWSF